MALWALLNNWVAKTRQPSVEHKIVSLPQLPGGIKGQHLMVDVSWFLSENGKKGNGNFTLNIVDYERYLMKRHYNCNRNGLISQPG